LAVNLCFGGCPICVRAVQPNAFGAAGFVQLSADHVPALAQVHHPVVKLSRPALGRYPDPVCLGHFESSLTLRSGASGMASSSVGDDVSRLNRLLNSLGPSDRTWCCDRCRQAALAEHHAIAWKHPLQPGEPHSDLPELEADAAGASVRSSD